MLVQARQALKRRLDILRGYVADLLGLQDAHEPPVAVAVVHEKEGVALDDIRLAFYGRCEAVEGVHKIEVDGLIGDRERRRAVIVVHVIQVTVLAV